MRQTDHVLLVTLDGLRWQEVFRGADESLINKDAGGGVRDVDGLRQRFWAESATERRERLMPFLWSVVAKQGRLYGDPDRESLVKVTNGHFFSYPGYNEILTGAPDKRIDSNDKRNNPNVTVLEWLHRRPGFDGRVAAFCSWDVFPFIINEERSGVPVNAGWEPFDPAGTDPVLTELDRLSREMPHYWPEVRYDYWTFRGAEEHLQRHRPRVLYVSLGETDDWAHAGRYDLYLDAARRNDNYIRRLWERVQSLPEYRGRTSLVITTDHGRGDNRVDWKSHGADIAGADLIWIAVLGPDTPADGVMGAGNWTQSQVAATVAELLGEDFRASNPQAAAPLPGVAHPTAPRQE